MVSKHLSKRLYNTPLRLDDENEESIYYANNMLGLNELIPKYYICCCPAPRNAVPYAMRSSELNTAVKFSKLRHTDNISSLTPST